MTKPLPSKTFCILPWIHFFHSPNGEVLPCCSSGVNGNGFGNIKDASNINDIVNSASMRKLRVDMLSGEKNSACAQCYREEEHGLTSFRQNKNADLEGVDIDSLVNLTDNDGTLHNFKMQYCDSRFSNVCNLKCRMCGPEYSHSLAEELYRGTGKKDFVIKAHDTDEWDKIIVKYGDLSALREVYFAGGEALYQKEHWQMLDYLSDINKHNIRITYTTNLSRLSFGSYKIENYLKKFTNVLFIVSLDGTEKLIEYIRFGCSWENIRKNIKTVLSFPNVKLKYNVVITIYNILYLNEILDFAIENTTNFSGIDLTMAHSPPHLNIVNLPTELKDLACNKLLGSQHYPVLKNKIDGVINYMLQEPIVPWNIVINEVNDVDQLRNEHVLDIVPEFKPYWK